jgi:hypothetical protein
MALSTEDYYAAQELALELSWIDAFKFLREQNIDSSTVKEWMIRLAEDNPNSVLNQSWNNLKTKNGE